MIDSPKTREGHGDVDGGEDDLEGQGIGDTGIHGEAGRSGRVSVWREQGKR